MKNDLRTSSGYRLTVIIILLIVSFLIILLSISFGSTRMTPNDVFKYLFIDTDSTRHNILLKLRVPRALAAGLVGSCLAISGCLLQGVMRNPLASPNIIGVSAGAGFAAVLIFILFPGYYYMVTPAAFLGSLGTTILVYSLSWKGGASPLRLVLSGIAVASFLGALSNALMIFFPDRIQNTIGFMVGSLNSVSWQNVNGLWPYALGGLLISWLFSDRLNILLLGDETAVGLGLKVERSRLLFIILASLLASSAVSVVGLLGFVGLIVPHITRLIIGNNARFLIPASALSGAIIVMLCDLIGRVIMRPLELPVGIVMAVIGAPFFLHMLRRSSLNRRTGK